MTNLNAVVENLSEDMKDLEGGEQLRKELQIIQRDVSKTPAEKQKLIQAVLMRKAEAMKSETKDVDMKDENQQENRSNTPSFHGRNVSFDVRIVNYQFTCPLCTGYFREASTVKECLHTFCKSCIFKYFIVNKDCPTCHVSLGPQAWSRVKYDRQLQGLVDKLFAAVVQKDLEAERDFWSKRGVKFNIREREENITVSSKPLTREEAMRPHYTDEIEFILTPDLTCSDPLAALQNDWLKTTIKITIGILKRYILQKLKLRLDPEDIELMYNGIPVANEHSLEYILRIYGVPQNKHEFPELKYKRKRFAQ